MRRSFPPAPTQARAVVLQAHPRPESFNRALGDAWTQAARAEGLAVETFALHDLTFDPLLRTAYVEDQPLEPDLVRVRDALAEAAHLVVVYPTWWSSTPAVLKGFFDRVFLPHWAFRTTNGRAVPGLAGRSARMVVTMDAPVWYDTLVYFGASRRQVRRGTLAFSGFHPVHADTFGSIEHTTVAQRERMLQRVAEAGRRDASALLKRFESA